MLFDNIPDSVQLLDFSRFWLALYRIFGGVVWFFEAPFYVPPDSLYLSTSVERRVKRLKRDRRPSDLGEDPTLALRANFYCLKQYWQLFL